MELGISWIWMGLESPHSNYSKLNGADTLQAHPRTARARHQAAGLHHRRPGAPHAGEHPRGDRARRRARDRLPPVHALHAGARHAALLRDGGAGPDARTWTWPTSTARTSSTSSTRPSRASDSKKFLDWAFRRDFERNGPSLYRICRTTLEGGSATRTIPTRACASASSGRRGCCGSAYAGLLWAMEHRLTQDQPLRGEQIRDAAQGNGAGVRPAIAAAASRVLGPVLLWTACAKRSAWRAGQTYEPRTIIERRNWVEG